MAVMRDVRRLSNDLAFRPFASMSIILANNFGSGFRNSKSDTNLWCNPEGLRAPYILSIFLPSPRSARKGVKAGRDRKVKYANAGSIVDVQSTDKLNGLAEALSEPE
jgi:hypothetical protein